MHQYRQTVMSANPSDPYEAYTLRETAVAETAFRPERRRRPRTKVHWTLLLRCDRGVDAVESVTRNLSSSGFSPETTRMRSCGFDLRGKDLQAKSVRPLDD
jgi:hypothetical protein